MSELSQVQERDGFVPLAGFKSLVTHHCFTGSMRHIYHFHGYPISEEMLLGLGSGLGFIYWHMKGTDPFFGGRANVGRSKEEGLEITAGRRTGVKVEAFMTASASKAEKAMIHSLEAGEPFYINLDMGYLSYLGLPEDYHFGAHVVVVAGYDPETRRVLIADRDPDLHPVSMADLAKARGSTYKPFPPKHKWNTFDFASMREPSPEEVKQAIREVTTGMLEPPIANLGVKGIRTAAKRAVKWPDLMDEEALRRTCFNIFIFIDATGGTGGGIFRYMYSRFLQEAAEMCNYNRLREVSKELKNIGDIWQAVAYRFKESSEAENVAEGIIEATKLMLSIADREQATWQKLRIDLE